MADHLRHMPEYFEAVRARLMKGIVAYEDKSFSKAPADLLEELKQEALDLAGWGFILFSRLQAMSEALEAAAGSNRDRREMPQNATIGTNDTGKKAANVTATMLTPGSPLESSPSPRADSDASQCDAYREAHDSQPPIRMVGASRVAP